MTPALRASIAALAWSSTYTRLRLLIQYSQLRFGDVRRADLLERLTDAGESEINADRALAQWEGEPEQRGLVWEDALCA